MTSPHTRTEILDELGRAQDALFMRFRAFTTEELERVCTESEVPEAAPWRPKDHLTHLGFIERRFQGMIRRTLEQEPDPIGFRTIGAGNREEVIAWVHRQNQAHTDRHAEDTLEEILTRLTAIRQQSLELIEQLSDEQLLQPVPGAPWDDGTVGGVLITNARHAERHTSWVAAGLLK